MSGYTAYTKEISARIRAMPLKDMDSLVLQEAIFLEVIEANKARPGAFNISAVAKAIHVAAFLHRTQTRADRREMPVTHYVEHPLRNALRLLRYGVTDQVTIIAAILHDTVEDCADEMVSIRGYKPEMMTEEDKRARALGFLAEMFPIGVNDVVLMVSNPFYYGRTLTQSEKHAKYVDHVSDLITNRRAALVKFADWVDNALSLQHNDQDRYAIMTQRLAHKYAPLVPIFLERMQQEDIKAMLSPEGYDRVLAHLVSGAEVLGRLSTS